MILYPNAKINIGLNIVEKRPDGYHNLETVFYPIHFLKDTLEIHHNPKLTSDYNFSVNGLQIVGNEDDNLVVKALKLLKNHYPIEKVDIKLSKSIPFGAGLGGGSADAAFTLNGLNELFQLGIDDLKLEKYATQLGADCPVFIKNKPVYAESIGNEFTEINLSLAGYHLVVVKSDVHVSTAQAYAMVKPTKPQTSLIENINMPITEWKACIKNDFEVSVFNQYPEIGKIKSSLYDMGAVYASMSGSGSSVYGLFENLPNLDTNFPNCFVSGGILQ
jgi:4-diphosphocytidyl-2-C-methyl-D-erythritol kinase